MSPITPQIADTSWKKMEYNKDVSPLLPVARFIQHLSYVGCPLTLQNDENHKNNNGLILFKVVRRPLLKFAASTSFGYLLFFTLSCVFYSFNITVWNIMGELEAYGFAAMDVIAMVGLYSPVMMSVLIQYWAIKRACEKLSIFSREMSSLKDIEIFPNEAKSHFKTIRLRLYLMTLGTAVNAFLYAYMSLVVQKQTWNFYSFTLCLFGYATTSIICFIPPILLLSYLLPQHCLGMVELALKKCADKFSDKFDVVVEAKVAEEKDITEFVDMSLHLARIIDSANEALGMVMLIETVIDAFSGTLGFYFGTIIIDAFAGGGFNEMLFIGGLVSLIMGIIYMTRLVNMLRKGQRISDEVGRIKALLRNVLIYQDPTAKESKRIGHLINKWSTDGAPVRPCDLFDLNGGTGMSIAGVLLTYVIVLFQFKHGG